MGACESRDVDDADELLYSAAVSSEVGASMMELQAVEVLEVLESRSPKSIPGARIAEAQNAEASLISVAAAGDVDLVQRFLMDTDTDIDHVATSGRHTGKTALLAACESGCAEVVQALLSARASLDTQSLPNYEGRRRIASTPILQVCYQFIRRGLSGDTKVQHVQCERHRFFLTTLDSVLCPSASESSSMPAAT